MVAARIIQLQGEPDFNPATLMARSHAEYVEGTDLIDMIRKLQTDENPEAAAGWEHRPNQGAAVESMGAMGDDRGAVALLCPDAPLVQFGSFHFGPPLEFVPRPEKPLLLAWPVNNYWDTNFPLLQPGRIRLRYGFVSLGALDVDRLLEYGQRKRQPALTWPVTTNGRADRRGLLSSS